MSIANTMGTLDYLFRLKDETQSRDRSYQLAGTADDPFRAHVEPWDQTARAGTTAITFGKMRSVSRQGSVTLEDVLAASGEEERVPVHLGFGSAMLHGLQDMKLETKVLLGIAGLAVILAMR